MGGSLGGSLGGSSGGSMEGYYGGYQEDLPTKDIHTLNTPRGGIYCVESMGVALIKYPLLSILHTLNTPTLNISNCPI